MHILLVKIRVIPDGVEAFKRACAANAEATLREEGAARYDVVQDAADPTRFLLIEAYLDKDAHLLHRQMPYVETWRQAVNPLMAEPRVFETYVSVFPETEGWFSKKH